MRANSEKVLLSRDTLEKLCIACVGCKDINGKIIQLFPEDVLQPWILDQLPHEVKSHPGRGI